MEATLAHRVVPLEHRPLIRQDDGLENARRYQAGYEASLMRRVRGYPSQGVDSPRSLNLRSYLNETKPTTIVTVCISAREGRAARKCDPIPRGSRTSWRELMLAAAPICAIFSLS